MTINLRPVDIAAKPIVYLLNSTKTNLLAFNKSIYDNKSFIEMDLLPGDYQVVVASDSRNEAANFELEIAVDNDAPQNLPDRGTIQKKKTLILPAIHDFPYY